jgi:hypothetical protein
MLEEKASNTGEKQRVTTEMRTGAQEIAQQIDLQRMHVARGRRALFDPTSGRGARRRQNVKIRISVYLDRN